MIMDFHFLMEIMGMVEVASILDIMQIKPGIMDILSPTVTMYVRKILETMGCRIM